MQYKAMHQIFSSLYSILKKWWKLSQKTDFLAHFERFFIYALLHPIIYLRSFSQIKCLMDIIGSFISVALLVVKLNVSWKYIIIGRFISVALLVVKLQIFKVFVAMQHPWNGHFWEVSAPSLPQTWLNFAEALTRGILS